VREALQNGWVRAPQRLGAGAERHAGAAPSRRAELQPKQLRATAPTRGRFRALHQFARALQLPRPAAAAPLEFDLVLEIPEEPADEGGEVDDVRRALLLEDRERRRAVAEVPLARREENPALARGARGARARLDVRGNRAADEATAARHEHDLRGRARGHLGEIEGGSITTGVGTDAWEQCGSKERVSSAAGRQNNFAEVCPFHFYFQNRYLHSFATLTNSIAPLSFL
jgi:hypothetical protein